MGKRKLILGQNKKAGGKSFKVFCVKGGKRGGGDRWNGVALQMEPGKMSLNFLAKLKPWSHSSALFDGGENIGGGG